MLSHYLTLFLRRIWRDKQVNLIRVGSLSLGFASGLVIFLVVNYMFSFDRYHPHMDRSYWVVTDVKRESVMQTDAAPRPLAEVLRRDYPFVESAVRLETFFGRTISIPDGKGGWAKKFNEARNMAYAEPQYFDLFGVEWISGDPEKALKAPNSIVLSERYALKYFNTSLPIGRTLRLDNRVDLTVTGIIKNPPGNTQLRYDGLVSYSTIPALESPDALLGWQGLQSMCFVLLREGASPQQLAGALNAIPQKHLSAEDAAHYAFQFFPLADLNHERSGMAPRPVLFALIVVGLLLVAASCINYVNLATAQAMRRSLEVGIRKVAGGSRLQLLKHFMLETALLTFAAVAVALLLTQLAMPVVNQTLNDQDHTLHPGISIVDLLQPNALIWFGSLITAVILLAGLYPSWVMSGFDPKKAIAGQLTRAVKGFTMRRTLIAGQFLLAQLFLIVVLVITAQLRHMQKVDWGFLHEGKKIVWLPQQDVPRHLLRESWSRIPGVESVSFASDPPASPYNRPSSFSYNIATRPEPFETRVRATDEHYLPAFGLSLVAGRNFNVTDTTGNEVLVNETLVRQLGVAPASMVIGKRMRIHDADRIIVGVVKDFRSDDLHKPILPVTLIHDLKHTTMAILTLSPKTGSAAEKAIQEIWDTTLPDQLYKADSMDDLLNSFTKMERLLAGFVQIFAFIAVAMSCLGLFGLITFMAETRAKEIGVRRVLGARTEQLLWVFGKEFSRLLVIGFLIAAPLGWWLTTFWLQQYAHRIQMNGWLLIVALGLMALITALTILGHAWKAAVANPVRYLRAQ